MLPVFYTIAATQRDVAEFTFTKPLGGGAVMQGALMVPDTTPAGVQCQKAMRVALTITPQSHKRFARPAKAKRAKTFKPSRVRFFRERTEPDGTHTLLAPPFAWLLYRARVELGFLPLLRCVPDPTPYINPLGLLPFQAQVTATCVAFLQHVGGCVGIVPCGMGKTEVIAAVTAELGVDTVAVTPKLCLVKQVMANVVRRVPSLTCTEFTSRCKDASGQVVVTTTRSLPKLRRLAGARFRLMILDEVHHAAAKDLFTELIHWKCRRLGLTATLRRSDGFEHVIPLMVGPVAVRVKRPWIPGIVRMAWLPSHDALPMDVIAPPPPPSSRKAAPAVQTWMASVTQLMTSPARNAAVVDALDAFIKATQAKQPDGRVLILCDRRRHAIELCRAVGGAVSAVMDTRQEAMERARASSTAPSTEDDEDDGAAAAGGSVRGADIVRFPPREVWAPSAAWASRTCGLFLGAQPEEEQADVSAKASVVWTTASMAYEGLDLKNVCGVAILTKTQMVEQLAGRGLRMACMPKCAEFQLFGDVGARGGVLFQDALLEQIAYFTADERWPLVLPEHAVDDAYMPSKPISAERAAQAVDFQMLAASARAWHRSQPRT